MRLKKLLLTITTGWVSLSGFAQFGTVVPLHVNGKQLNDPYGNKVVLHGVMDTPSPYFNRYRWGSTCTDNNVNACIGYFDKLFGGLTDTKAGAYCNIFRLHLEPAWTNDPGKPSAGSDTGEANISRFSSARLQKYLTALYLPIARKALSHGLYVVVRPPGVCPKQISVNGAYHRYLKTVWDIVTKNQEIKNLSGVISIELANEPIQVLDANGLRSAHALRDFFQPIVDIIRRNGFKGIIWVPGEGYQSQYQNYAAYPINDSNYGYAVHVYPGWYGAGDDNCNHRSFIDNFQKQVPVVGSKPILVSEIDWSPAKPGTGKYNEFGQWVSANYGTWGTASTSKWGLAWKAVHDHYGNISMTLTSTDCYLDIDALIKNGRTQPAFGGMWEASSGACWAWYKDWAKADYPHAGGSTGGNTGSGSQPSVPSTDGVSSSIDTSRGSMIPEFSSGNNTMPYEWTVFDNGAQVASGTRTSGPRIMRFAQGGDFADGMYLRTISGANRGYAEYGRVNGRQLYCGFGNYWVQFSAAAWKGSPYVKAEILNPGGNVVASRVVKLNKNLEGNANQQVKNADYVGFSFYALDKGNYVLRITPAADATGNTGDWVEIIVANVGMFFEGNPLAFSKDNVVPQGWNVVEAGNLLKAGEAGSGPRVLKFGAGGDFGYGLYVRQSDNTKAGYAEYGATPGYGISLLPGNYTLSYNAVAWKNAPFMKCEVINAQNKVVAGQTIQLTRNVDGNLGASTAGSNVGVVRFSVPTRDNYHFRWTPVADRAGNAGFWLVAVIGHIKVSYDSSAGAKESVYESECLDAAVTAIETQECTAGDADVWYTSQGVRLAEKPSGKGIFIRNGRKVVVR